jgi:hypothetical protein
MGLSFHVTVHMPSSAWNTISTEAASSTAAMPDISRRRRQARKARPNVVRIRPPARNRCTCSRQALCDSTARSGNARLAASISWSCLGQVSLP